ncbi:hypothetical protein [uncultured Thiodictyon sp.]|uniref:hypothetical protein n=1 Tax=uncultured Thiodictyon sp. TaxID=1846217 RepID=UPI0025E1AC09|nr:hypothetical protein [uncultured Thiodictyon sp.]
MTIKALSEQDLVALVDQLILEQGRLDPLELLMACDYLAYADYESWRLGGVPHLEGVLRVPADQAAELLARAGRYAAAQHLAAVPLEHRAWGTSDRIVPLGPERGLHPGLVRGCANAFAPPADRMQLDLFHDSQDQLLEEAVRTALTARRIDAAHTALTRLMALDPRHPRLRRYLRLMQAVEDLAGLAAAQQLQVLEALEPEVRDLLGHRARDLLAPLWVALAQALAGQPFDPNAPETHAGYAWARAGRHPSAREAIEALPDWRRWPVLLLAHAQACRRMGDPAAARRDWAVLCWEHPAQARLALAAKDLPDARLVRLWWDFGDADLDPGLEPGPDQDIRDFPAWLLLADPGTAAAVPPDLAPVGDVGEAYRLLHRLVSGADGIPERAALARVRPGLLKLYLAARASGTRRGSAQP